MAARTITTPGIPLAVDALARPLLPPAAGGAAGLLPADRPDRLRIEAAIETLIGILDTMDGDADREPDTDQEPGPPDPSAWHWPVRSPVLCAPIDVLLRGVRS